MTKKYVLEYIWLDINEHIRSKIRVITTDNKIETIKQIPKWSYDGSSTGQSTTLNSEILLEPIYMCYNSFLISKCLTSFYKDIVSSNYIDKLIVLCNTTYYDKKNENTQERNKEQHQQHYQQENYITEALEKFSLKQNVNHDIWFGIEQEFFLFDKETLKPFKWDYYQSYKETLEGEFYCGVNRSNITETKIMEEFLEKCLLSNLNISGINQEVEFTQWEYQIGPVKGIESAHQMIVAKFILLKICEKYNLYPVFHPKPIKTKDKEWNGSGCHINISTEKTRNKEGIYEIYKIMEKMEKDHSNFIENYCGKNNHMRLTGKNETSNPDIFSYSIGGRNTSIRIPYQTKIDNRGYFEDRRPGSDINYYKIITKYLDYLN